MLLGDPQSGRSLGLPENFQRRDVAPNRQISRTESRETWPLRTRLVLFGSFFGSAIEARKTRSRIDAGARSRPNALALAAPSDRTTPAQRPALARRITVSPLQVRNWLSCARSQVLPNCLTVCHPVRNWRRAAGSRFLSVALILRFPSYKAFREVRDDGSGRPPPSH
jgi:hypothetical protein